MTPVIWMKRLENYIQISILCLQGTRTAFSLALKLVDSNGAPHNMFTNNGLVYIRKEVNTCTLIEALDFWATQEE